MIKNDTWRESEPVCENDLNSISKEELKKRDIIQLGSASSFGLLKDKSPIYLFSNNSTESMYKRGEECKMLEYNSVKTMHYKNTDNTNRHPDNIYFKDGNFIDRNKLTNGSQLNLYSMYTTIDSYETSGGRKKRNTKKKRGKKSKKSKTARKK
jgi:hypothetical protein